MTPACMGGWCALREHCAHYHADPGWQRPSERLCHPGHDGHSDVVPVVIRKPVGAWEALPSAMFDASQIGGNAA